MDGKAFFAVDWSIRGNKSRQFMALDRAECAKVRLVFGQRNNL